MMSALMFMWCFHLAPVSLPRPPVTHVVPHQDRLLQMENGIWTKLKRRGRVELLVSTWRYQAAP